MRYNPECDPDPAAWLDTDEVDRLEAIRRFHSNTTDLTQGENPRMHALVHLIIENQLAMTDGTESTKAALARLRREGLDRHEAVHAIGSVVAQGIAEMLTSEKPLSTVAFTRTLDTLSAATWRAQNKVGGVTP
jgi:hypothetical protein